MIEDVEEEGGGTYILDGCGVLIFAIRLYTVGERTTRIIHRSETMSVK